jgi:hypothetical protein
VAQEPSREPLLSSPFNPTTKSVFLTPSSHGAKRQETDPRFSKRMLVESSNCADSTFSTPTRAMSDPAIGLIKKASPTPSPQIPPSPGARLKSG